MKLKKQIILFTTAILIISTGIFCSQKEPHTQPSLTIASYNCGGLSDHYDYLRAVAMGIVTKERFAKNPEIFAQFDKIQNTALKIIFSNDEKDAAVEEWVRNKYTPLLMNITSNPLSNESINHLWNEKANRIITPYNIRPIVIKDSHVYELLQSHMKNLIKSNLIDEEAPRTPKQTLNLLTKAREAMAKRIFREHLKYDIIALQEADYLTTESLPDKYDTLYSNSKHSLNGVAWDKTRFSLVKDTVQDLSGAFIVNLFDNQTKKTISVASAHLTGCNPFLEEFNSETNISDAAKGNEQLHMTIKALNNTFADIKIIAMDSNVCATHPRLNILKENDFYLDYNSHLEATCTSPWQILNTRIDWIAIKSENQETIQNLPIKSIELNSHSSNMSDHKPIASQIYLDRTT
ncbi:MAG: hypothetical protein S4CHLAM20_09780 [Chlamydiia bacterium]|nr:hypothetical protein [Chlamydiia bacterium]